MTAPTTKDVRVTVRLSQRQADWLASLAQRSMAPGGAAVGMRLAADTLAGLLAVELRSTGSWTVPELLALAQAIGQPLFQPDVYGRLVHHELTDATVDIEEQYAASVGMDSAAGIHALRERVEEFSHGQDLAVRDALSRWWDAAGGGEQSNDDAFRAVGFHVVGT